MRGKWALALILGTALLTAGPAWGQTSSGAISGAISDDSGKPLVGAVVTVTSPHIQGERRMVTDLDGMYLIPYLPPGHDLQVVVEAPGFNKVVKSGITVSIGTTTLLNFGLSASGQEVKVTASSATLDLRTTKYGINVGQTEIENIPIGRAFRDIFYLAPNVAETGLSPAQPGAAGGTASENVYTVDGMDFTDPVGGILFSNFSSNFIREAQINLAGLGAESGSSTGGLFNVLTKSGTNEFHGELFGYYNSASWAASAKPASVFRSERTSSHAYDWGFDLGGPIVKDRLWFFAGYNPTFSSKTHEGTWYLTGAQTGALALLPYAYDDVVRTWSGLAKLTWRINADHNLELSLITNPSHSWLNEGSGNLLNSTVTVPVLHDSARQTRRYISGFDAGLRWYATFETNFYMETGLTRHENTGKILPWDSTGYAQPRVMSFDWYPKVSVGYGIGDYFVDKRTSTQFDARVTYLVRRHEIKFGVAFEDQKWDSDNPYSGGVNYEVAGAYPFASPFSPNPADYAVITAAYLQNPHSLEKGRYMALFAQDRWAITENLNLAYGARWEQTQLRPQQASHYTFDALSPRVGLTWDFTGDGRSKFYVNYGRYYERVPISATYTMDPGHQRYFDTYYLGNLVNHYVFGETPTQVLPGTKPQYNDEILLGAEYQIAPDFVVGLSALYRSLGRALEDVAYINDKGTMSYYLMNPGSSQWPSVMNRWGSVFPDYERFPKPIRNYQAYTLQASKRFADRWHFNASYTYSFLRGNYEGGTGGYVNSNFAPHISYLYDLPQHLYNMNRYGWLPGDIRHQIKAQGSYRFDWGLVLGANFLLQSGRPLDKIFDYPLEGPGNYVIYAAPRGSDRLPSLWELDLHAEYTFKIKATFLAIYADLFNVTNRQAAVTAYPYAIQRPATLADVYMGNLTADPNWGKATSLQAPRYLRLGLKFSF